MILTCNGQLIKVARTFRKHYEKDNDVLTLQIPDFMIF